MHAPHRGRRLFLSSIVVLVFAAITCRNTVHFDLDHTGTASLAAGDSPASIPLTGLTSINLSVHPLMVNQGLHVTDLTEAKLTGATLSVNAPTTGSDLSFLSSVDVELTADNMQPVTVATAAQIVPHTNLIPLTLVATSVTGYLKGKNPTFTLKPTFAQAAPQNVTLGLNLLTQVRVGEPAASCKN